MGRGKGKMDLLGIPALGLDALRIQQRRRRKRRGQG